MAAVNVQSKPIVVSLIIPCYNYAHFLPEAVASVVAQTYSAWEIVIVDDGSRDATLAVAQQLIVAYPERQIRLFHQPNAGAAAARNTGARAAQGELLVFLDADDLLDPAFLERTVSQLQARPELGFVYTGMRMIGDDDHVWPSVPFDLRWLALDNFIPQHALVRAKAWQQVGGFDAAHFPHGFEDWDFWLRVVQSGWLGAHIAAPLVSYRRHGPSLSSAGVAYEWDARAQIIRKHPQLYGPRLVAWACARLARQPGREPAPLPQAHEITPGATVAATLFAAPQQRPRVTLRRRLVRAVPFALRFRVKCWLRRGQLALRSIAPWLFLAER